VVYDSLYNCRNKYKPFVVHTLSFSCLLAGTSFILDQHTPGEELVLLTGNTLGQLDLLHLHEPENLWIIQTITLDIIKSNAYSDVY